MASFSVIEYISLKYDKNIDVVKTGQKMDFVSVSNKQLTVDVVCRGKAKIYVISH